MMTEQPENMDVVLGGQVQPPVTGAVLGGLEGLQRRFPQLEAEQKLEAMPVILDLGQSGIELLIAALSDSSIVVRVKAYQYLQQALQCPLQPIDLEPVKSAIAAGIPLKPGDTLYSVYQIPISYDDECYYLCTNIPEVISTGDYIDIAEHTPADEIDWELLDPEEFDFLMEEWEVPKLISRHLLPEEAEQVAEKLHQTQILSRQTPSLFEFDWSHTVEFNTNNWRTTNGLSPQQPEQDWWKMGHQLVDELKAQQQVELLSRLWKDTAGRLAVVHEQMIDRHCYFKATQLLNRE